MPETDPAHPWTAELSEADLQRLGAQPLHRNDPVTIGPYRVLARLGGGGMGRQYLGRDTDTDAGTSAGTRFTGTAHYDTSALVAVKVIRPEYAEDPRFRRRFEREVAASRRVHGRYTAELLGSGFDEDEHLWMATAYVPGPALDDAVDRFGPLPAPVVWRLAGETAQALATIGATGIVHRDLKPSNILLAPDGVRLIDFGVARTTDASALTMTGQQVGTPAFMSPEQAEGREATTASDVFSLGSVLAHVATGRAPFGEGSTADVIHRVVYEPPDARVLGQAEHGDRELGELIRRCLDKEPGRRPAPEEIVEAARQRGAAPQWPPGLAELIADRAAFRGSAAAVAPMAQETVLRRGAPQPTSGGTDTRQRGGRRRTVAAVVAAVVAVLAVAGAAYAFLAPGGTQDPQSGRVHPSSSSSHPRDTASPSRQPDSESPGPPDTSPAPGGGDDPAQPPAEDGGAEADPGGAATPGGDDDDQAQPPPDDDAQPPPRQTTTRAPEPPSTPQKPWRNCRYYSGTALTDYGDTGNRVRQVQCILKARGYNIGPAGVDGQFGQDTVTCVRRFQSAHGLQVDGQVGTNTWAKLRG
ncbi:MULTISPECIES: serine/threonine-protein kinase [unclassified Streptomyces]|uniref:serine/threonine-protein kinase n=1 Tax=unclassified Streptomyces TaxID=2593676 RepID=UPI00278BB848|nr:MULTISPECIES: serine/threonine-protein kinase [unclassified Streptomyces]